MMMRRMGLALVLTASLGVGVSAQQWIAGGCARCIVVSYVDVPLASQVPTVSQSQGFVAHGWGFLCEQGLPVNRIDVWYQQDTGYFAPLTQPSGALIGVGDARPDVQAAYAAHCPGLNAFTGWRLRVTHMPPIGTRQIAFTVWREPYYEVHYRQVEVVQ